MIKRLSKYIFSSIFAMMGISCYILADTYYISVAAGANGITALNLTLPLYAIMYAIGAMIGIGSATKFTIDKSADTPGYNDYFANSVFWILLFSLFFFSCGLFFPDKVMLLMGADATILDSGLEYMQVALCFAPVFMSSCTVSSFVRNDHSPHIAMAATFISSLFNIFFDYLFVFPMGLGMLGAALATAVSPIVSMGICLVHFLSKRNTVVFVWKRPSLKKLLMSCKLGVSGFIGEIAGGITTLAFNFVLLHLVGNVGVAAYGIVANIALVAIAIFNGIAQGLQPMASEAAGQNDEAMQKKVAIFSLNIALICSILMIAVCWVFAEPIVNIFNSEQSAEMASYAVDGLKMYSIGFLMAGINIVTSGYYGAIGKAKECFVISFSRGIVAIVAFAYLLPKFFGVNGVWYAFPVAELFTFMLIISFNRHQSPFEV